jgi:hypothetical protein
MLAVLDSPATGFQMLRTLFMTRVAGRWSCDGLDIPGLRLAVMGLESRSQGAVGHPTLLGPAMIFVEFECPITCFKKTSLESANRNCATLG